MGYSSSIMSLNLAPPPRLRQLNDFLFASPTRQAPTSRQLGMDSFGGGLCAHSLTWNLPPSDTTVTQSS